MVSKVGWNAEGSGAGVTPALRGRLPPARGSGTVCRPCAERGPGPCLFLWSWDIAQPSPPPKSMWVVDSDNATTAAVGIKRIVML